MSTLKVGRGADAPPFIVMDVIARAAARERAAPPGAPRVLRMEVGQPGTGLPDGARRAVEAALRSGSPLGYTEMLGRPSLRARIAAHYADWYGLALPAARVAVTVGASGAFPLAFLASFEPGDRVALASPYYPPYLNVLKALGLVPVVMPAGIETGFQPTVPMLEALDPRPAGLILASPANPTGAMLAPAELEALARWCHANGVRLISDEIYHGLTYGKAVATAAAYSPSAIVINSFSKYFSMTGWRVGWMVLPDELVRPVERLSSNLFISAPYASQVAAEAAFDCGAELEANRAAYARSRQVLLGGLARAGFATVAPSDGAFYAYADIADRGGDSMAWCERLLDAHAIASAPGVDFDAARGHDFVRFSFCGPEADIAEAARRLAAL